MNSDTGTIILVVICLLFIIGITCILISIIYDQDEVIEYIPKNSSHRNYRPRETTIQINTENDYDYVIVEE